MNLIRVLIVDDHLVVRRGLRSMLADAGDVEIVGGAANAREAIEQTANLRPDVLLLDIRMPGMNGLRLLRCLRERFPDIRVIILTNYDDEQFLLEAFRAGAFGYLLKNVSREDLLEALRTTHQGKRMLSPELMDGVLKQFAELGHRQAMDQFGLSGKDIVSIFWGTCAVAAISISRWPCKVWKPRLHCPTLLRGYAFRLSPCGSILLPRVIEKIRDSPFPQ